MAYHHILAINPGSTSTKVAVYVNTKIIFLKSIPHDVEALKQFMKISDQFEYRRDIILEELENAHIELDKIAAIVGRGGLIKPIKSGTYIINEEMKKDLRTGILGEHASNLGGLIADSIAQSLPNAKAYIADPVVVDELEDVARITGHPKFHRLSIFHALNQKATARSYARLLNRKYEEMNLIIAHLGGGITVGAHKEGRVIDVNQGLDGEGPLRGMHVVAPWHGGAATSPCRWGCRGPRPPHRVGGRVGGGVRRPPGAPARVGRTHAPVGHGGGRHGRCPIPMAASSRHQAGSPRALGPDGAPRSRCGRARDSTRRRSDGGRGAVVVHARS